MSSFRSAIDWLLDLGREYHVDPFIFAIGYVASKIAVVVLVGWAIRNRRKNTPYLVPLLAAAVSFSMPYFYVIIAGENISHWVYVYLGAIYCYGAYSIWRKLRKSVPDTIIEE